MTTASLPALIQQFFSDRLCTPGCVPPRAHSWDGSVMIRRAASTGVPLRAMAVLMLSVFTVSMGLA
jgi:hypothetical protein